MAFNGRTLLSKPDDGPVLLANGLLVYVLKKNATLSTGSATIIFHGST